MLEKLVEAQRLTGPSSAGITQRSQVRILSPLRCPRYEVKRPSENPPGAVFMSRVNGFVNVR
jgi:hypothetical protein